MTVLITLTIADADTGPFDLYSNLDLYTIPFETNVSKAALQAGYSSALVPDGTSIIRAQSVGVCKNYTDIVLTHTTSTTTSTTLPPEIACGQLVESGGEGITDLSVNLSPFGGVVVFAISGETIPDKFEIYHNGTKKATSGIATVNGGPFDDVYGTPPSNVIPTGPVAMGVDQFIGINKDPDPPSRDAAFHAANPSLTYIVASPRQQLIWWNYTPSDYFASSTAMLRVTGPTGTTVWYVDRRCPTTTSTSSTSSTTTIPPTTTSTTTVAPTTTTTTTVCTRPGGLQSASLLFEFTSNSSGACGTIGFNVKTAPNLAAACAMWTSFKNCMCPSDTFSFDYEEVQFASLTVGNKIYLNYGSTVCTTAQPGFYFFWNATNGLVKTYFCPLTSITIVTVGAGGIITALNTCNYVP